MSASQSTGSGCLSSWVSLHLDGGSGVGGYSFRYSGRFLWILGRMVRAAVCGTCTCAWQHGLFYSHPWLSFT
jgi:hypothetical protein